MQYLPIAQEIWKKTADPSGRWSVYSFQFQYVAAHCGVSRNELADTRANEAVDNLDKSNGAVKVIAREIKKKLTAEWKESIPKNKWRYKILGTKIADWKKEKGLSREERVLAAQLRCGKCRLLGKFRRRIGASDDRICRWCGLEEETVEHVLESCVSRVVRNERRKWKEFGGFGGEGDWMRCGTDEAVTTMAFRGKRERKKDKKTQKTQFAPNHYI